jgi:hypothetical protein
VGVAISSWFAWGHREGGELPYASHVRYGQNELAPNWMPKSWVRSFLREVHLDVSEALFARDLTEIEKTLRSSNWIERVAVLKRSYDGEVELSLAVRRPICLMKNRERMTYLDDDLQELSPFYGGRLRELVGEKLPLVDVSAIVMGSPNQRDAWLAEMVTFLKEWMVETVVLDRFHLDRVQMSPYRAESSGECRLELVVVDRKFGGEVRLSWGIHRDYNELEDRYSKEKWDDLKVAIGQSRKFDALDLRYKRPEIQY